MKLPHTRIEHSVVQWDTHSAQHNIMQHRLGLWARRSSGCCVVPVRADQRRQYAANGGLLSTCWGTSCLSVCLLVVLWNMMIDKTGQFTSSRTWNHAQSCFPDEGEFCGTSPQSHWLPLCSAEQSCRVQRWLQVKSSLLSNIRLSWPVFLVV